MTVAPAAPEAGLSLLLVIAGLMCVFLIALNKAWKLSVGALLETLANMFYSLSFEVPVIHKHVGLGFIGDALKNVDTWVLFAIGVGIQNTEKGLHAIVGWMTWVAQATADEIANLSRDVAHAFHYVESVAIPAALKVTVHPIVKQVTHVENHVKRIVLHPVEIVRPVTRILAPGLNALEKKVDALAKAVAATGAAAIPAAVPQIIVRPVEGAIPHLSDITKGITSLWKRVHALEHEVAATGAHAIPNIIVKPVEGAVPDLSDITRGIGGLWTKVKGITRTLTPAGIVGLVAGATLATLGLSWLKCRNVGRAGKQVCGINPDILDGLLIGLTAIFGTIGLVAFAERVQGVTDEFAAEAARFWRADKQGPGGDRAIGQKGA